MWRWIWVSQSRDLISASTASKTLVESSFAFRFVTPFPSPSPSSMQLQAFIWMLISLPVLRVSATLYYPSPPPSPPPPPSNSSGCFPSQATLKLKDGRDIRMNQVSIGDVVQVNSTAPLFEPVLLLSRHWSGWQRLDDQHVSQHITLTMLSGHTLILTPHHLVPVKVDGNQSVILLAAKDVVPLRDHLTTTSGPSTVVAVGFTRLPGLHMPITQSGLVVVDGVLASCWTSSSPNPTFMTGAMYSLAILHAWLPASVYQALASAIDLAEAGLMSDNNGIHWAVLCGLVVTWLVCKSKSVPSS